MALEGLGKDATYLKTCRRENFYLNYSLMPCVKADVCPDLNMHIFILGSLLKYISSFIKNEKNLASVTHYCNGWSYPETVVYRVPSQLKTGSLVAVSLVSLGAESYLLWLFLFFCLLNMVAGLKIFFWTAMENNYKTIRSLQMRGCAGYLTSTKPLAQSSPNISLVKMSACRWLGEWSFPSPPLIPEVSTFHKPDLWSILALCP